MKWFAIAACLVVGCKGGKSASKHDDAALRPIDAAALDAAIDTATADASVSFVISSDGVGPLTIKVTEEDAFKKLLPGFAITSEHHEAEDYSFTEIVASKDDKAVLRAVVQDGKLFKVEVRDPRFATSAGIAVGMTTAELAGKLADLKCTYEKYDPASDAEHVDRALRCESQTLPRILFEIDNQGFKGRIGAVAPKVIASRKIDEIVWLAPAE